MKTSIKVDGTNALKIPAEKSVFISHATKDKGIIDAFVDIILHGGLSVPINKIFCVSTDGTKIQSGENWRDSIKESLLTAKVNFLIITPNYKESEICLNEMGAAWVTSAKVIPLIVDPIIYKTVGILQEPSQIEKMLEETSLDRIKDIVQDKLEIPPMLIKSDRWTVKKNEFLIRVKEYLSANPFKVPMDRNTFDGLLERKTVLEERVKNLDKEKFELKEMVNALKEAKDKSDVAAIIRAQKPSSKFQEFREYCDIVKKKLAKNNSIINGIIYKSYSGKNVTIKWEGNNAELDEAISNDFIDEELDVIWEKTKKMHSIKEVLDKISDLFCQDLETDFYESYEEQYDAPMDLRNKIFWEEVFEASISFN